MPYHSQPAHSGLTAFVTTLNSYPPRTEYCLQQSLHDCYQQFIKNKSVFFHDKDFAPAEKTTIIAPLLGQKLNFG